MNTRNRSFSFLPQLAGVVVLLVNASGALGADPTATFANNNEAKDYALDRPDNWKWANTTEDHPALPQGNVWQGVATIPIATTGSGAFCFTNESAFALKPTTISLTKDKNMTFDLGEGNSFLALTKFNFNVTDVSAVLKSGTMGVDWDSDTGDRLFMGDNGGSGSTITVDGPTAVLSGSKKSTIQVGTGRDGFCLNVINGGTVRGHVSVGAAGPDSTNNLLSIAGEGSRLVVPESTYASPLTIGGVGSYCRCVVTNRGEIVSSNANAVLVGNAGTKGLSVGNRMELVDQAQVTLAGELRIGAETGSNTLFVAGGSVLRTPSLYLSTGTVNYGQKFGNSAVFEGEGTRLVADSVFAGRQYATDAFFLVTNGAAVSSGSLSVGALVATNNLFLLAAGGSVDLTNSLVVGSTSSSGRTCGNRLLVDGGCLCLTNEDETAVMAFSVSGCSNALEVTNGGLVDIHRMKETTIGGAFGENRLVVSNGGVFQCRGTESGKAFQIGGSGAGTGNALIVDGGCFYARDHILRVGGSGDKASMSNYVHLTHGATCEVFRVICSENGQPGQVIDVDDSAFRTCRDNWGTAGAIQLGLTSSKHLFHVHGRRACVDVASSFALSGDSELRFTVEKDGFENTPVLRTGVGSGKNGFYAVAGNTGVVRIDVADDFTKGGTYTLIDTGDGVIDWSGIDLVYDPKRIRIVEKSEHKLVARAKGCGLLLIVR